MKFIFKKSDQYLLRNGDYEVFMVRKIEVKLVGFEEK